MILKEAYRYQNYLDSLIDEMHRLLFNEDFIMSIEENHNKSKVDKDATDEVIKIEKPNGIEYTPNELINLAVSVIEEKQKLSDAIEKAKQTADINIDSSLLMNKIKQDMAKVFNSMVSRKNTITQTTRNGYKFDVNNEQRPYYYPVEIKKHINFDRDKVKALVRKYNKECDEISTKLDLTQLTTEVDYTPIYELNSSIEDIITG